MAWLTVLGILVEGIGLFLAGRALLRVWRDVADGRSLLTNRSKTNSAAVSGTVGRVRSHVYARVGSANETTEEAVIAIRSELDAIYRRLDLEADTRQDADEALRHDVDALGRAEDARERDKVREDTRAAALGLFWAVGGILLQLLGGVLGL
ncbi:hypothetical protein [Agromyces allii]|uniref:Uncharacterized protein n=1 Tax=Agromyces allii TaxID=393607 RepID=A0ABN2QE46_9MICO